MELTLLDPLTLLYLIGFGFLASFIDAVVGGGGLISLPALMMTGLPPVTVLGTNKAGAVMGACASFFTFLRSGQMNLYLVKRLFPLSLIGSALGVCVVQQIPASILRPLVVGMLILVLIYTLFKKDWGTENKFAGLTPRLLLISAISAFALGFYDGFFGPGTGSFLLFAFLLAGFDFLGAAANARALNFASNISGVILFAYFGNIDWSYALPMGLSMIVGAHCGARTALRYGSKYVRPLFIVMTTLLIGKQLLDLLR